jgi:tRNA(Arg) A34 adenosine deaminase TadA
MRAAIELALGSVASGGGPFGAVVVREGRIVGRGANRVVPSADPTAHAEILAIREAARVLGTHELSGCAIYASAEPCPMCLGAILWARLAEVHYGCTRDDAARAGFDDGAFHAELARPLSQRSIVMVADGREEALAAFRAWTAKPDRVPY